MQNDVPATMNYPVRNIALWRWCLITFWVSLAMAIIKPFGLHIPNQSLWLIPSIIPSWLTWSIINTLFVLTSIWLHTNVWSLSLLKKTEEHDDRLLALIQGAFIGFIFGQVYSLLFLVIVCWILWVLIHNYFSTDQIFSRRADNYGLGAMLIYFYMINICTGYQSIAGDFSWLGILKVFVWQPVLYLGNTIIVILTILLAYITISLLWRGIPKGGKKLWRGIYHIGKVLFFFLVIMVLLILDACDWFYDWCAKHLNNLRIWIFPPI